ncbi:MAG: hypothetical protein AAB967_03580, partial [Patescibacteria group bacterium]
IAQEFFPRRREEIEGRGWQWREPEERRYVITIRSEQLPDHITDAPDTITNEIIGCVHGGKCEEQCTTAFRITPEEFAVYKTSHLPLPRFCPNCRHFRRLAQRTPLRLWKRKCQCNGLGSEGGAYTNLGAHFHSADHCPNELETSYAPERPEIVYCEACYNSEVA